MFSATAHSSVCCAFITVTQSVLILRVHTVVGIFRQGILEIIIVEFSYRMSDPRH